MAQGFGVASSVPLARGATINWVIETFAHIPSTNIIIYNISTLQVHIVSYQSM